MSRVPSVFLGPRLECTNPTGHSIKLSCMPTLVSLDLGIERKAILCCGTCLHGGLMLRARRHLPTNKHRRGSRHYSVQCSFFGSEMGVSSLHSFTHEARSRPQCPACRSWKSRPGLLSSSDCPSPRKVCWCATQYGHRLAFTHRKWWCRPVGPRQSTSSSIRRLFER